MIDGFNDPYEQAESQQGFEEARLMPPAPPRRNGKVVLAALVFVGVLLVLVILSGVGGMLSSKTAADAHPAPKPVTMTKQQSADFQRQQSGQAEYMGRMDRGKNVEDVILGQSNGLADDAYAEVAGVPEKTKAQDEAEHGRNTTHRGGKSEAQQLAQRGAPEAVHRRQNDLDSSPLSVDFSDYFDKQNAQPTASPAAATADSVAAVMEAKAQDVVNRHHSLAEAVAADGHNEAEEPAGAATVSPATNGAHTHDPTLDYAFDSASGKLYRLMEDTVIETVLVNRLAGAAAGPIITMVSADVYSGSGFHLLIPRGTRMLGGVTSVSGVNQERLFVTFHRMIMPDGYSVSLDKFQGLDVVGQTGLRDLVNHHYLQIFGASLALAAIGATAQVGNTGGSNGSYDWGVSMRNGASQQLGQSAQRIMERFMNTLPTFTIRERAMVKIMLSGDLLLPDIKNHTMDPDM